MSFFVGSSLNITSYEQLGAELTLKRTKERIVILYRNKNWYEKIKGQNNQNPNPKINFDLKSKNEDLTIKDSSNNNKNKYDNDTSSDNSIGNSDGIVTDKHLFQVTVTLPKALKGKISNKPPLITESVNQSTTTKAATTTAADTNTDTNTDASMNVDKDTSLESQTTTTSTATGM